MEYTDVQLNYEYPVHITNLEPGETYYIRAYVRVYGEGSIQVLYYANNTVSVEMPTAQSAGDLNGEFTINENGGKVKFSKGNLQYNITTQEWSFMDYQYAVDPTTSTNVGTNYANYNIVTHFGWGTSGYAHRPSCYQPYSTSSNAAYYYAYNNMTLNLYDSDGTADWGYNAITNGGNVENSGWRTLTKDEWRYLLYTRHTDSGKHFVYATVDGTGGFILLPDDWDLSTYTLNTTLFDNWSTYTWISISASDWADILEPNGAVFLPNGGYRSGTSVTNDGYAFRYWTSSNDAQYYAYYMYSGGFQSNSKTSGCCVRLVKDVVE